MAGTLHSCFLMLSGIGPCQEMAQDCERVNGLRPIRSPLIRSVGSAGTSKRTSRQITRMALGGCNLGAESEPEGARVRLSQSSPRLTAQGLRPLQFRGLMETQLVITICFQPCRVSVHKSAPSDGEHSPWAFSSPCGDRNSLSSLWTLACVCGLVCPRWGISSWHPRPPQSPVAGVSTFFSVSGLNVIKSRNSPLASRRRGLARRL